MIGYIFYCFAILFGSSYYQNSRDFSYFRETNNEVNLVLLLFMLVFGGIGWMFQRAAERQTQTNRNLDAEEVRNESAETKIRTQFQGTFEENICLYLRPFSSEQLLLIPNSKRDWNPFTISAFAEPSQIDLEAYLADVLEPKCKFIALGYSTTELGAGKINTPDHAWQTEFKRLSTAAQWILVFPSSHEGTQWEIQWLKENKLFEKSTFIMPPESKSTYINLENEWHQTRLSLMRQGIELPLFENAGLLFKMNTEGKAVKRMPLVIVLPEVMRVCILGNQCRNCGQQEPYADVKYCSNCKTKFKFSFKPSAIQAP